MAIVAEPPLEVLTFCIEWVHAVTANLPLALDSNPAQSGTIAVETPYNKVCNGLSKQVDVVLY